jgi:cytochrome c
MQELHAMKLRPLLILPMLAMLLGGVALAGDRGTPEEAKAMAIKAAALVQTDGLDKAKATFAQPEGAFHDRDLWVFIWNTEGTCVFSGATPSLMGKTLIDLKDADGTPMVRGFIAVKDAGWTHFKWMDPMTKKIAPKTAYIISVGDLRIGVGAYE